MQVFFPSGRSPRERCFRTVFCIVICLAVLQPMTVASTLPFRHQAGKVTVDSRDEAWKAIDAQLAKIAEAESTRDIAALRAIYAPEFISVQPNGEKLDVDRVLGVQASGLKQVLHTICLNPTIVRMELKGDKAYVTVLWDWARMQRMAGKVRRVQTSSLYEETWVKMPEAWKRLSVGARRSCTALVDDKPVDIGRPYDPEAPPYDPRNPHPRLPLADMLYTTFTMRGAEAGLEQFRSLRSSPEYYVSEVTLNALGYRLLAEKKLQEAVAVLRLNTQLYPHSANAFDSLGEALLATGDKREARASYRRSLKLNPKNDNARQVLKRLSAPAERGR